MEAPYPTEVLEAVFAILSEKPHFGLRDALEAVGPLCEHNKLYAHRVGPIILEFLNDTSPDLRVSACTALAFLPSAESTNIQALHRCLSDTHISVRAQASAALGDIAESGTTIPKEVLDQLSNLVTTPTEEGFEAAIALAMSGDPRGQKRLHLSLDFAEYRPVAISALGKLGLTSSIPFLQACIKRWFIPWSDRTIGRAVLAHLGDRSAFNELLAQLASKRFEERIYACVLIGQWSLKDALPDIKRIVTNSADSARDAAIEALISIATEDEQNFLEDLVKASSLSNNNLHLIKNALLNLR